MARHKSAKPKPKIADQELSGKTLLALGWPGGPVIGLGLAAAATLGQEGYTERFIVDRLEQVRRALAQVE